MSPTRHSSRLLACTIRAVLLAPIFAALSAGCSDEPRPTGPAAPHSQLPSMIVAATATNGKIAFASDGEIYVVNADGSGRTNLTNSAASEFAPAWSPDGTKLAFDSNLDGNTDIYVMNADGLRLTRLTNDPASDRHPTWSPDGTKLAFSSDRDGNGEIYVMNADGSGQINLTNHPALDNEPDWSPDGTKLVFTSHREGSSQIYIMNPDGTAPTGLTRTPGLNDLAAWSPDGSKIVFHSSRSSSSDLWVISADGSGPTRLTNIPSVILNAFPAWSPDGTKIAFTSSRDGPFDIFVINADGSGLTNLTNDLAADFAPDWQPGVLDLDPPVLTVPTNVTVEATSAAGAVVSYSVSVTDNVDPAPVVSCDRPSGTTFPLGNTTVTCTATDAAGNTGTASFPVMVVDTTSPVLSLPADFAVDATSPGGAVVSYTVSASDAASVPTISCTPASGSLFAFGTHTVNCTATDGSGNSTTGSFLVTVKGAEEQITDLRGAVAGLDLEQGIETSLEEKLAAASSALARGARDDACGVLQALINQVNAQSGKKISATDAAVLIAEAERIRTVLGC